MFQTTNQVIMIERFNYYYDYSCCYVLQSYPRRLDVSGQYTSHPQRNSTSQLTTGGSSWPQVPQLGDKQFKEANIVPEHLN